MRAVMALLAIATTLLVTPATSKPQLYGDSGYGSLDSYGEPEDFAIIRINGRESEISSRLLLEGYVPLRNELNVYSADLISGPPGFGFFLWSSSPSYFVSQRLDQDMPQLEASLPLSPPSSPFSFLSSPSSSSARRSRTGSRSSSPAFPSGYDPASSLILFPNAEKIYFYNLERPQNQIVAFIEWLDGSTSMQIVDLEFGSHTVLAALRSRENRIGRWRFGRTQRHIRRVAILHAPRGRKSKCRLDMIMKQYEVTQDRPVVGPFYGVTGMICYK